MTQPIRTPHVMGETGMKAKCVADSRSSNSGRSGSLCRGLQARGPATFMALQELCCHCASGGAFRLTCQSSGETLEVTFIKTPISSNLNA
ncbi:hypothetical protein WJX74_010097 [Apatococcus lobatus]|uniref:Uncharacterized protein n=1 Tax=Apatococcus lobatus TaxID=904363 RepID=A0AAW1SGM5_9CHLO